MYYTKGHDDIVSRMHCVLKVVRIQRHDLNCWRRCCPVETRYGVALKSWMLGQSDTCVRDFCSVSYSSTSFDGLDAFGIA